MTSNNLVAGILGWLPRLAILLSFGGLIPAIWILMPSTNKWLAVFATLFVLRYARLLGHLQSHFMYRPAPVSPDPAFRRSDVTVVVLTTQPTEPGFRECIRSILGNQVAVIMVVTVGRELKDECRRVLRSLLPFSEGTTNSLSATESSSKRAQLAHIMPWVTSPISVLVTDNTFWPSNMLIPNLLAPFENDQVGAVATKQRPTSPLRTAERGMCSLSSLTNFIARNSIERQNWELQSSLDGGICAVSGRTAAYRTSFLADTVLLHELCHEKLFFGLLEKNGMVPDEVEFLTRAALKKGWLIRFQSTAVIETDVSQSPRAFHKHLIQLARTTLRSNAAFLCNPDLVWRYTWSTFMVHLAGLTNFALVWDAALIGTLVCSLKAESPDNTMHLISVGWLILFICFLVSTKVTKILPALLERPSEFALVPLHIAFGWSGQSLDETEAAVDDMGGIPLDEMSTIEDVI